MVIRQVRSDNWVELGELFSRLMAESGHNGYTLHKATGVCQGQISRMRRGLSGASRESLAKLSRAMELSADEHVLLMATAGFWPWDDVPTDRAALNLLHLKAQRVGLDAYKL